MSNGGLMSNLFIMKNYRNLIVWQKSHLLVLSVYEMTKKFPKEERYNLVSQLRRAGTSVPTNIAEGCGKFTQRDFVNYLQTAFGSLQEVEYLSFLSFELAYVSNDDYKTINFKINEAKAMLISLIKKIRNDNNR
jgi:four helix bundle protein